MTSRDNIQDSLGIGRIEDHLRNIGLGQKQELHQSYTVIANVQPAQRAVDDAAALTRLPSYATASATSSGSANPAIKDTDLFAMKRKLLRLAGEETSHRELQPVFSAVAAATAIALHNSCVAWCSCRCHTKGSMKSAPLLDPIFGSVSMVYGGISYVAGPCDQYSCRRRSDATLRMNYRFPQWMHARLFQLSMALTPMYGLRLNLKTPRAVPWGAPIWGFAMNGNVQGLQDLFSRGIASPWDVNPIGGSALHVSPCSLLQVFT